MGTAGIHAVLARSGQDVSPELVRQLVRQLMRELGLTPVQSRPWRPVTTLAGDRGAIPDLVSRDHPGLPATRRGGRSRVIDTEARWEQARRLLHDDTLGPRRPRRRTARSSP